VKAIVDWLESIAPFSTAEPYDNVGLLAGDPCASVDKALFCLDVTDDVVREAVDKGAQLIIAHHPLMFSGVKRIDYTVPEGRILCALLEARLNLIVAHTNWDRAQGGVSDSLAEKLGLREPVAVDEYVRMGNLETPLSADAFAAHVQNCLGAHVRVYGEAQEPLSRVAVGPGACGELVNVAVAAGAQAFVVGEIDYDELLFACGQGLVVFESGHYATEFPGMVALYHRFQDNAASLLHVKPLLYSKAPFRGARSASQ